MSDRRFEFHEILVAALGSRNVYFQPPSTLQMKYRCIVYARSRMDTKLSNDQLYGHTVGYMVTVIDPDPDSEIPNKILNLPMSRFVRHYTADNLNHDVFNVYY